MELKLKRHTFDKDYTEGELFINGVKFCDTLEDEYRVLPIKCPYPTNCICREKVKNETAIPLGKYSLIISMSNRFKKELPEILNVPHFLGIRIHSGNTDKDSSGCILVGEKEYEGKLKVGSLS